MTGINPELIGTVLARTYMGGWEVTCTFGANDEIMFCGSVVK